MRKEKVSLLRKAHKRRGQPEENSRLETLRFFNLFRLTTEEWNDHKLRQRYLQLWEKGMMEMELSKEQVEAMIEAVQKMTEENAEGEGDECNDCTTKQMEEKLREINKPTKEKTSYIA
jgi:hypothetical protein